MESTRRWQQITVFAMLVGFFIGLSGCLAITEKPYEGDGEYSVTRSGFFQQELRLTLNQFDARESYQNHRQIVRLNDIESPYYFQLRVTNTPIYADLYHSAAYRWERNGSNDFVDSTVDFAIKTVSGETLYQKQETLDRLPTTSPQSGVIDFLLFAYRPDLNTELRTKFKQAEAVEIHFSFEPRWDRRPENSVKANLVMESGQ